MTNSEKLSCIVDHSFLYATDRFIHKRLLFPMDSLVLSIAWWVNISDTGVEAEI